MAKTHAIIVVHHTMLRSENKMQLHFYISDYNEKLILQAGTTVEAFLKLVAQDAVDTAKQNRGEER